MYVTQKKNNNDYQTEQNRTKQNIYSIIRHDIISSSSISIFY